MYLKVLKKGSNHARNFNLSYYPLPSEVYGEQAADLDLLTLFVQSEVLLRSEQTLKVKNIVDTILRFGLIHTYPLRYSFEYSYTYRSGATISDPT